MKTQIQTSDVQAVLLTDGTWYRVAEGSFEIVTLLIVGTTGGGPLDAPARHREVGEAFTFVQFERRDGAERGAGDGDRISGDLSAIVAIKEKNAARREVVY
jgi:hypothetical protein